MVSAEIDIGQVNTKIATPYSKSIAITFRPCINSARKLIMSGGALCIKTRERETVNEPTVVWRYIFCSMFAPERAETVFTKLNG